MYKTNNFILQIFYNIVNIHNRSLLYVLPGGWCLWSYPFSDILATQVCSRRLANSYIAPFRGVTRWGRSVAESATPFALKVGGNYSHVIPTCNS